MPVRALQPGEAVIPVGNEDESRKRAAIAAAEAKLAAEAAAMPKPTDRQRADAGAYVASKMGKADGFMPLPPEMDQRERGLIDYHRDNLRKGTYLDDDQGLTTVYIIGKQGPDGREYNIPGFADGKRLTPQEAGDRANEIGWDRFPSYATPDEADTAAKRLHGIIEADVRDFPRPASQERPTGQLTPTVRQLRADEEVIPTGGDGGAGVIRQFGAGANEEIANLIDAPGTLARPIVEPAARAVSNAALRLMGKQPNDTPIPAPPGLGVTDALRDSPAPASTAERIARSAGQVTGQSLPFMAMPFMAPARTVAPALPAPNAFRGAARTIADSAQRAPVQTLTAEAASAGGAGAGGQIAAEKYPDSPAARAIGEILGGFGAGAAVGLPGAVTRTAGAAAEKLVLPAMAMRAVRRMVGKPVETGAERRRAAGRLRETVPSPEQAVRALDDPATEGFGLTPAQRIGEPELLSLERSIMDSSATLRRERRGQFADVNNRIRESLKSLGGEGAATPEDTRAYLGNLLDTRLRVAAARADEKIARLGDNASRESANVLARREIESALTAARQQENALWRAVPSGAAAEPQNLGAAFDALAASTPAAQRGSIPGVARRLLTPGEDGARPIQGTAREIQGLRSELLEVQRRARSGGRSNMARIAGDLADAALGDLEAAPDVDGPLAAARNFSRDLNDRFTRGPVGRLLGYEADGGAATPSGLTLESTVGAAGARAREETDAILRAMERTGDTAAMRGHVESFLRDGFRRAAVRDGRIDPARAQSFLRERQDVLARFPELRRDLEQAAQAGDAVRLAEKVSDPEIAAAAIFTRAEPGKEIDRVLAAPDPGARMKALLTQARTDPTGKAEKGIRAAFIERLAPAEAAFVRGTDLRRSLANPKTAAAIGEIYTPRERQRLLRIARAAELLENAAGAAPSPEGIAGGVEDLMSKSIAGVLGAHAGRALNTGTIQAPGRIAAQFEKLQANGVVNPVRKLLTDAVRDEELFRTLFTETSGPKRQDIVLKRLNAWAAGVLGENGPQEAEE